MKKQPAFKLLFLVIIFLALFLRFYNFPQRFWIYADQARDVMVAKGALKHKTLPLIGSFASAGPFVFGPLFYWFIMAAYLLAPQVFSAPWILITLVDCFQVLVLFKLGQVLSDKKLGLILSFLSAISTNQILRAANLTQHTFVGVLTSLTILFFILFYQQKKAKYLFFMGLSIAAAISMHYQALNLLLYTLLIFAIYLPQRKNWLKLVSNYLFLGGGLLLPSLPLLYWDSTQEWSNIKNILDYFLIGQYRFWVSNRWLTYIFDFWPQFWARVVGGIKLWGIVLGLAAVLLFTIRLLQKKLKKETLYLGIIFFAQFLLYRYYRGERLLGYVLYFQPLVLIFSAWLIRHLWRQVKLLAILLLLFISFFTIRADWQEISQQDNHLSEVKQLVFDLQQKYPGEKFQVYDFHYWEPGLSQMLSLLLDFNGLSTEKNGIILGVSDRPVTKQQSIFTLSWQKDFYIYQLDQEIVATRKDRWVNVNAGYIYQDMLFWWQQKPLTSTFSLGNYLKEKF